MAKIQQLPDPQAELLLLRSCSGVSKLYFTLPTTYTQAIHPAASNFGMHLMQYLRKIIVGDGAGFGSLQQRYETFLIEKDGLGILTMTDVGFYCYLSSCHQTRHLQNTILPCHVAPEASTNYHHALLSYIQACGVSPSDFDINHASPQYMNKLAAKYFDVISENLPTVFTLTERDLFLWHSNKLPREMNFLKAIPISGLGQAVGPRQFRVVLQYRLGIPIFYEDGLCSSCEKPMDVFGDHALHCAKDVGLKYRQDVARDAMLNICYKDKVPARKEASLDLRSNSAKDLKPADILVINWEGGKDVCFDVTCVPPFTSACTSNFTPGHLFPWLLIASVINTLRNALHMIWVCSSGLYY